MNDTTGPGAGGADGNRPQGPWGPRSAAAAMAAAEQAARPSVPPVPRQDESPAPQPQFAPPPAYPPPPGSPPYGGGYGAGPAPGAGQVAPIGFSGLAGELFSLLLKGFFLQIITLGIYRFWFITDMRRFYWSHTSVGNEQIAYTGRGIELFKGFLVALAIIVPIQAGSFFLVLGLPSAEIFISPLVTLIFLFLAQYAVYAGRRYRLTRTAFRGLRFRMVGSAWSYAFKAFGLWLAVLLTLGLAYPWAAAILERIKMRDTWYGDVQGDFVGTAGELMRQGLLLWVVGFGLPIIVVAAALYSVPSDVWNMLAVDFARGNFEPRAESAVALFTVIGGVVFAFLIVLLLVPAFQAVVFRWRMNGTRLGGAALISSFSAGAAYRVYILGYLALFGIFTLFSIGATIVFGGVAALVFYNGTQDFNTPLGGVLSVVGLALAYVVLIGGFWIAKQLLITLRLYRAQARSVAVLNLAALDNVKAVNVDASAMGDSLGDAVDVLGF